MVKFYLHPLFSSKITVLILLIAFTTFALIPYPAEAGFIARALFGSTVGRIISIVATVVLAAAGGPILGAVASSLAAASATGSAIAGIGLSIITALQSTVGSILLGAIAVGSIAQDAYGLANPNKDSKSNNTPPPSAPSQGGGTNYQTQQAISAVSTEGICGKNIPPSSPATTEDPAITAGIGKALSCPAGNYLSGEKYCVPVGKVSCASVGKADAYCEKDFVCTSDLKCKEEKNPAPQVTVDFKADNPTAVIGTKVVLSWTSSGATSCELDHNIGGVKTSGYLNVSCTEAGAQSLTLKCAGRGGEVSKTATIDCQKKPPSFTEITPFGSGTKIKCGTGVEIIY